MSRDFSPVEKNGEVEPKIPDISKPDLPFHNYWASKSGDYSILCIQETPGDGFWSSKVVKGSDGKLWRGERTDNGSMMYCFPEICKLNRLKRKGLHSRELFNTFSQLFVGLPLFSSRLSLFRASQPTDIGGRQSASFSSPYFFLFSSLLSLITSKSVDILSSV